MKRKTTISFGSFGGHIVRFFLPLYHSVLYSAYVATVTEHYKNSPSFFFIFIPPPPFNGCSPSSLYPIYSFSTPSSAFYRYKYSIHPHSLFFLFTLAPSPSPHYRVRGPLGVNRKSVPLFGRFRPSRPPPCPSHVTAKCTVQATLPKTTLKNGSSSPLNA